MKSKILHKSLKALPLLLLFGILPASSQPMRKEATTTTTTTDARTQEQSVLFIDTNAHIDDAQNYQISIEKDPQPGQPCLTISWKTNPDGSGPPDPKIYYAGGYFKILPYPPIQSNHQ